MYLKQLGGLFIQNIKLSAGILQPQNLSFFSAMASSNFDNSEVMECVKSFVPAMTNEMRKGQCGRIGVVGGCQQYTGAPYFSAISALKVGADISHVFCMEAAGPVIKSYSPELIVHPVLDQMGNNLVAEALPVLHSVVIGPGLGRDPSIYDNFKGIILKAIDLNLPVVIDADGVYFITQDPSVIKGYRKCILTPNGIEFIRLYEKIFGKSPSKDSKQLNAKELALELDGVTVVCKGEQDIITDGTSLVVCSNEGSARRCGGQGDLLSGSMGTFVFWAYNAVNNQADNSSECSTLKKMGPNLCAAYGACYLTRECNKMAFLEHKRSMTTSDMIHCIGEVFEKHFENKLC